MTDEWSILTDEQLAEVAHRDLQGRGAWVEAMRRLRIAIENLSVSSNNSARQMRRWIRRWTVVVAFLTLVQAIAAAATIMATFPRIEAWLHQVIMPWFAAAQRMFDAVP